MSFKAFYANYRACALWTECDENDVPLGDRFEDTDFSEGAERAMFIDARDFYDSWYRPALERYRAENAENAEKYCLFEDTDCDYRAGMDFWLSRNGHGAGFWDGINWPDDLGRALHDACKPYGGCSLFVNDDDLVDVL